MADAPNRNDADSTFTRRLQELEKTLQQTRLDHEQELKDLKVANINFFSKLNKSQRQKLEKLDLDMAKKVSDFQVALRNKYSQRYQKGVMSNAKMEKKIAAEVMDFIDLEKRKRAVQEKRDELNKHQEKLQLIRDEHKVELDAIADAKKANKRALQDGTKSHKQYAKERKKLIEQENALKKKTADKLRKEGATELDIMQETGQISTAAVKEAVFSKETASAVANNLVNGLKQMFESTIQTYGTYQTKINTRLQGSGSSWQGIFGIGGIESNIKNAVGSNPYVKLQSVMDNVVKATEAGIANNIEQRAFLGTISESIAATFDAFDSNLMRVIRLQQADTTAARLGLEAGLTSFLNENFKDNSYLNNVFDTVSQNLIETTSQLTAEEGVALEYNIQKWLGSLYSVGFSDTAIGKISEALGYLGSGNVSALASNSEMQNLIVMAASRANMSYSDLLIDGLDSSNTNKLLRSMVEYLGEIAESDNKVVKSEYAQIFGMSVADLKAVTNLEADLNTISTSVMSYGGAMNELYAQMNELPSRISVAGMMQNLFDNVNYSIGTGIASNPVTYALWQITSMIEDLTGGIALPTVSIMGNMVDLNTTITNLMRAGIVGVGSLGAIGSMISGISSTLAPSTILAKLGIANSDTAQKISNRGKGLSRKSRQVQEQSASTLVGNTSGDDYYQSTLTSSNEQVDTTIEQKKQESTDITLNNIHEYLLSVFDPKMTEIERLVALLAGYETKVDTWGNFTNEKNDVYKGSTVQVLYGGELQTRKDPSDILDTIKQNTSGIYDLLKSVVEGTSSLTVKQNATPTLGEGPGVLGGGS